MPVVECGKHRENHAAHEHVVEVGDDEIGVMRLPIEGYHAYHHAGQPTHRENYHAPDHE